MVGCGLTTAVASSGTSKAGAPWRRSPGAGAGGADGCRSALSHTYWPDDRIPAVKDVPSVEADPVPAERQAPADSSQNATTKEGDSVVHWKEFGTLRAAEAPKTNPWGATSAVPTGDQPVGRGP